MKNQISWLLLAKQNWTSEQTFSLVSQHYQLKMINYVKRISINLLLILASKSVNWKMLWNVWKQIVNKGWTTCPVHEGNIRLKNADSP